MSRKRMKGSKYSRVTQQQKYIFLKLCITQRQSIHEAAFNSGIHYSTAKTILFFHKKKYKNYTSYFVHEPTPKNESGFIIQASWKSIHIDLQGNPPQNSAIEIIVNSKRKVTSKKEIGKYSRSCTNSGQMREFQQQMIKMQQNDEWRQDFPDFPNTLMNAVPVKDEYKSLKNDKKDDQLELYRDAGNIK